MQIVNNKILADRDLQQKWEQELIDSFYRYG